MKHLMISSFIFFFLCVGGYGQNSSQKNLPDFFKYWLESPEYIYGKVKEIHIKSFDGVETDGEFVEMGIVISNSNYAQNATYFFNNAGQLIQCELKNLMGDWTGVFSYKDDALKSVNWLLDNVYQYHWDYTYVEDENLEITYLNVLTGEESGVDKLVLDQNGFFIEKPSPGNNKRTDVFERKNDGTITDKKTISQDGKIYSHFDKWEYDDHNNKLEVHRAVLQGNKVNLYGISRTYEYDEKGNWIKQTTINPANNNIRIVERSFVFYE